MRKRDKVAFLVNATREAGENETLAASEETQLPAGQCAQVALGRQIKRMPGQRTQDTEVLWTAPGECHGQPLICETCLQFRALPRLVPTHGRAIKEHAALRVPSMTSEILQLMIVPPAIVFMKTST